MPRSLAATAQRAFVVVAASMSIMLIGVASGMLPSPAAAPRGFAPMHSHPLPTGLKLHPVGRVSWT